MSLLLLISRSSTATARTVSTAGLTASVTGLTAASSYDARVRARDAAGNWSAWSSVVAFSTLGVPAPATVAATSTVPGPVMPGAAPVTVTAVASIPAPAVGQVRTVVLGNVTTGQVTGLTMARNYTARVRARDAAGNWSAWSTPVPFTTTGSGTVSPATVAAVAAFPSGSVGGTPPTVTAGLSRPVVRGGTVGLDITATPPGGQTIGAYTWQIIAGAGSLTNETTATPTYTAPGTGNGLVTIRCTVSASHGGQATADMTVSYHATIIAAENALTGTARATWDLASPDLGGVSTLQGFADGFTVNRDATVNFKIAQSDTAGWSATVYRLGYYNGDGARAYGTVTPSGGQVTASQAQPAPADADPNTTLISADCAAWSTTLTWTPPAWAPTGMYVLRLNRTGGGASHVMFILRDDARHADVMFMPADSTWNAYNAWGGMGASMYSGNSLYLGTAVAQYDADCARFVSYNRPVVNRGAADSGRSYGAVEWSTFFTSEYGMLRFLERCGYDVKYYGCIDAAGDPTGTHLTGNGSTRGGANAGIFVGHNEYWSDGMRSGWETAKTAGFSVFSCAGNEVFWRLVGSSNDAAGRPRTWECFKSTIAARGSTGRTQWTGTWRDPDGAGKGGNAPENTFTGTIFVTNGPDMRSLVVPANGGYSGQPLWRNTTVAALTAGQSYTSAGQILGFEWDTYGPAGVNTTGANYLAAPHPSARYCSDATYAVSGLVLTDAGDEYGSGNVTHRLVVMPSSPSAGGITFGTGTVNWAFGVDNANTYQAGTDNTDNVLRQATINILADMGATATTPPSPLVAATAVDWFANPGTVQATTTIPGPTVQAQTSASVTAVTVAGATAIVAPTVRISHTTAPASVAAVAAVSAPTVRLSVLPTPAVVAGVAAVAAPTVRLGVAVTPPTATAVAAVPGPSVQTSSGTTAAPATVAAAASVPAAGVTVGAAAVPAVVAGVAAVPGPAVQTASGTTIAPAVTAATTTIPGPAVGTGAGVTATTVTASTAVPTRTPATTATATPASVVAVAGVPARTPATGAAATPAAVVGAATVPGPAVAAGATATPATVTGVAAVPGPSVQTASGTSVAPATVAAVAAVPGPAVQTSSAATATPTAVQATTAIGGPAVGTGTGRTPATVAATTTIGAPTIVATNSPVPGTVIAVTVVPGPTAQTGTRPAALTVAAVATVPAPTAGGTVATGPATVTATATIPAPSVRIFAQVIAATVTAVATVGTIRHVVGQVITSTGTATVTGGQLPGTVIGADLPARIVDGTT